MKQYEKFEQFKFVQNAAMKLTHVEFVCWKQLRGEWVLVCQSSLLALTRQHTIEALKT